MNVAVTHNEARQRFEATVDGVLCVCDYQLRGKVMWMTHTGVPPAVGPIVLPLMLFHQMQLMVCAVLAQRYARRPVEAAPESRPAAQAG